MPECLLIAETAGDGSIRHVWIKTANGRVRPVRLDDNVDPLLEAATVAGATKQEIGAWLSKFSAA
jgi:hypothetical protein